MDNCIFKRFELSVKKFRELEHLYGRKANLTAKNQESFKDSLMESDIGVCGAEFVAKFADDIYTYRRIMLDLYENLLETGNASFTTLYLTYLLLQLIKGGQATDGIRALSNDELKLDPRIGRTIKILIADKFLREIDTQENTFQYRTTEKGETLYKLLTPIINDSFEITDKEAAEANIRKQLQKEILIPNITNLLPKLTELDGLALLKRIQEELGHSQNCLPTEPTEPSQ